MHAARKEVPPTVRSSAPRVLAARELRPAPPDGTVAPARPADRLGPLLACAVRQRAEASVVGRSPAPSPTGLLQRTVESAALLKKMAKPQVLEFDGAEVDLQKDLVDKLEAAIVGQQQTLKAKQGDLVAVEQESEAVA